MRVADIITKRREIWEKHGDAAYDRAFCKVAVKRILSERALMEEVWQTPYLLIEAVMQVITKDRKTVPFFLNEVQRDFINVFEKNGTERPYFILKARQQGFTSLITAMQLCYAIVRKNFSGFTIAHRQDSLGLIFNDKARSVLVMLPEMLKPSQKFNSKNELFFDKLNSGWRVAVASAQVGRGGTFNFVHFSEVAFYECALADMQAGIGEAIAAGAVQIYESTANGFNEAKELWDSESCVNVFYPWYFSAEYRSKEYEWLDKCDAWLTQRKRLLFEMGLDREQVTWYCKKYNSYIDKALIRQEYPITAEEAFVASGDCVFDRELLIERLVALKSKPIGRLGYFEFTRKREVIYDEHGEPAGEETYIENIEFRESAEGYIRLHEDPIVRRDVDGDIVALAPYAIGADTSESGVDYFTAKVISVIGNRCVATLRKQKMDEEDFALQLYCLGRFYNDALIACEVNYSRHPIRVLRRHGYTNLFMRRKVDGIADAIERDFGFETTRKTKPIIISELVASFREDPEIECDIETLREMLTFVKKENGAQEAIVGKHDDLVMASAIGHFAAAGCEARFKTVGEEKPDFIKMNFNTADSGGNYIDW